MKPVAAMWPSNNLAAGGSVFRIAKPTAAGISATDPTTREMPIVVTALKNESFDSAIAQASTSKLHCSENTSLGQPRGQILGNVYGRNSGCSRAKCSRNHKKCTPRYIKVGVSLQVRLNCERLRRFAAITWSNWPSSSLKSGLSFACTPTDKPATKVIAQGNRSSTLPIFGGAHMRCMSKKMAPMTHCTFLKNRHKPGFGGSGERIPSDYQSQASDSTSKWSIISRAIPWLLAKEQLALQSNRSGSGSPMMQDHRLPK